MGVLFTLQDMGRIELGRPQQQFAATNAVDGDVRTRWSSAFADPQWLAVDLGDALPLSKVRLNWETAYAKDYELQVWSDGISWATARRVRGAQGGIDEQELDATARYVRLMGTQRATPYGYSLWEVEVFDSAGHLVSEGKHATASSIEDQLPLQRWLM